MHRSGVAALAALVLLGAGAPASAYVQSTSSKGVGLHWPDTCHVVYAHVDGSADVDDGSDIAAVKASLETWNAVECSDFTMRWGGLTNIEWIGYSTHGGNANIVIFHEEGWPYAQRPVAFTSVTYNPNTGIIFDADIELNAEDYEFTAGGPDKDPGDIDIQNTITHEAGHIVGLDHTDLKAATMYESSIFGEVIKRDLAHDDISGICDLYPATDAPPACDEVQKLDLWVDDPGSPPGPASNPSCATGGASPSALALLLLALMILLRSRRTA
jgi:MYXO-CTERM domain-containing protein